MKFSFLGIRLLLVGIILSISGSSCKNLFSKDTMPDSHCIECLQEFALSQGQLTALRSNIHADAKAHKLDSLFHYRAKKLGFNGNVLVIQKGVTLYENSFGYEDYRQKKALTSQSKFQLASLSKTFTAVAILRLMEEGSINLQDSVQQYYEDFPVHGITIEMLLCHRSGLPDYRFAYPQIEGKGFKNFSNRDLMALMAKQRPQMRSTPGRHFCYCNTNYAILAAIIEKITEMSFDGYMRQYVFEPLGMMNTFVVTTESEDINTNKTVGYNANWSVQPLRAFDGIVGDKGVYSTTEDLAKWYHTLNSSCFLKKETLDMAFEPRSFEKVGDKNYGLGFRMSHYTDDSKCIYHNGWWKGYNSLFYMSPKNESVVIVLGNRYNKSVYMVKQVMDILQTDSGDSMMEDELSE